jgi:hypothetical protein
MTRALLLALALLLPAFAHAGLGPNPDRDWKIAITPHFRVNYAAPQRVQAERIADIAERAYGKLSKELRWEPNGRIELVVVDEFDFANGFSTPYPFNETALFLTPPDEGELLDNSVWLEMLITHELTHTLHIDKVRGAPKVLRRIYGRGLTLFPNLWQPGWGIEGIATYNESTPEIGQGRLRSPIFEAWMRIEHEHGFKSLAEINADGRALPTSKQYLYGVYFYDFLARRYGQDAIYKYIDRYSGNFPLVARVDTNPLWATGKTMDELWDEFIADLTEQMSRREAGLKSSPRADGTVILPASFRIDSLAPSPQGGVLAVANNGVGRTQLLHVDAQGQARKLTTVHSGTRIDTRADGKVLLSQLEICDNYSLYYDLYTWSEKDGMQRQTECGRYRRAVWLGSQAAALRTEGGVTTLSLLDTSEGNWKVSTVLYRTPDEVEAIDLAASPDGKHVALSVKQSTAWQVLEFDTAGGAPRVLFNRAAPIHGLRYTPSGDGVEFIASRSSVYNLWRFSFAQQELVRLSNTYTAVTLHSGTAQDGSVVLAVLNAEGTELRRMPSVAALEQMKPDLRKQTALEGDTPPATYPLSAGDDYSAFYSMYPRTWMPSGYANRDLQAFGVATLGGDALMWHNYSASFLWETSQNEPMGSFHYDYLGHHFFNFSRNLWARQWVTSGNTDHVTLYDRTTDVQWASMLPWLWNERAFYTGMGAAMQTTDMVQTGYGGQVAGLSTRAQNEKVAAAFMRYDSRGSNWYADDTNRGNLTTLLYETYRPFKSYYNGHIVRFDTRGYLPIGQSVLSARWMEARAQDVTEPFYLGGSFEHGLTQAPMLNQRDIPLRGYRGGRMELRGQNARTASIEWRTPIADIDRHAMTPPLGINRVSASFFLDAGRAWDNGSQRPKYYRGFGVELHSEIKFIYLATLPLRFGIARGIDHPGETMIYLQVGQSF